MSLTDALLPHAARNDLLYSNDDFHIWSAVPTDSSRYTPLARPPTLTTRENIRDRLESLA